MAITSQRMKPRAMSVWIVRRGVEGGLPVTQRPRAGLLVPGREERDQAERLRQPAHDLVERRGPVAELSRLLVVELGELRLELAVDAPGAVLDGEERLRRQWIELGRELARPVGERPPGVEMRKERRQRLELGPLGRVARLRLLRDALVPALDVVAVGDEELELQGLEVVRGCRIRGEAVEHGEDRVDLAEVAEQLRAGARHVDDPNRRRRDLLRLDERRQPSESVVGDRRHADVRLVGHGRVRSDLRARARERVEERRLAAVRQTHDPDLERHRGSVITIAGKPSTVKM